MFFRGTGRQHWLSYDQGAKYQPLDPSFSIKEVKMHPTEAEWMLASHLTDGCKKAERTNCAMEVYLTQDLGRTWKLLQRYVAQFEWAPHGSDGGTRAPRREDARGRTRTLRARSSPGRAARAHPPAASGRLRLRSPARPSPLAPL